MFEEGAPGFRGGLATTEIPMVLSLVGPLLFAVDLAAHFGRFLCTLCNSSNLRVLHSSVALH